jgi:DNA-binding transcriptional LysR family regulator
MTRDLNDLSAFIAVATSGGFRDAARAGGVSASSLSEVVRQAHVCSNA